MKRGCGNGARGGRNHGDLTTDEVSDGRRSYCIKQRSALRRGRRARNGAAISDERQLQRAKRAAARDKADTRSSGGVEIPTAQALWRRAEALQPKTPWRAVAHEFGTNEAQALDCYRAGTLPPGMTSSAIERFLELPA
jgi:hypothetical protein